MNDKPLIDERIKLAEERTRLAAERTFTSWIRTGLAGVGGGLAIIHFLVFENAYHQLAARLAGQFLLLWGALLFLYALSDYSRSVKNLGTVALGPSRLWFMGFSALSLSLIALVFFFFALRH